MDVSCVVIQLFTCACNNVSNSIKKQVQDHFDLYLNKQMIVTIDLLLIITSKRL